MDQGLCILRQLNLISRKKLLLSDNLVIFKHTQRGPWWLSGEQVWHFITGCHFCVGSTPTSDNVVDFSQYDLAC